MHPPVARVCGVQDVFGDRGQVDLLVDGEPALIAREVLLRNHFLTNKAMTAFLCFCCAMTVSALYELIEWLSAVVAGGGAVEFLGTQGDPWDAQGDMLMALIGAIAGLATLSRLHDRQMAQRQAAGRSGSG